MLPPSNCFTKHAAMTANAHYIKTTRSVFHNLSEMCPSMRMVHSSSHFIIFVSFMFLFHISIIFVHFAVPTPQNSRRLTGNWREVAIYIHFCKKADGFDAIGGFICRLFILTLKEFLCTCLLFFLCISEDACLGVFWCVRNAVLQQFSSLLTAETNYMCTAGLGKCFLTACQYD